MNLHPIGRLVLPFVRTPTNILRYTLERTPLGVMSQDIRNMLKAGGPQASMAMARMQLGGAMLSLSGAMMAAGHDYGARALGSQATAAVACDASTVFHSDRR